jgi:transcriptional regulator GlxA family with amidase domain
MTKKVAILVYDEVDLLDFAGPGEVFEIAGYDLYTVAESTDMITSQNFLFLKPQYDLSNCPKPDILLLPGGTTSIPLQNKAVVDWIKETAREAEIVMSVCTGVFLLSGAHLLDGLRATTWYVALERLRKEAPRTEVIGNVRFVDNGKIITTGGVSSGIDCAIYLVSRLSGPTVAKKVTTYLEYTKSQEEGLVNC